jgi:hypothetical protein
MTDSADVRIEPDDVKELARLACAVLKIAATYRAHMSERDLERLQNALRFFSYGAEPPHGRPVDAYADITGTLQRLFDKHGENQVMCILCYDMPEMRREASAE